jgi:hypothetical protein
VGGKIIQNVVANLGRLDILQESGAIDSILFSLRRFSQKIALLGEVGKLRNTPLTYRRLGSPLLFGRNWELTR